MSPSPPAPRASPRLLERLAVEEPQASSGALRASSLELHWQPDTLELSEAGRPTLRLGEGELAGVQLSCATRPRTASRWQLACGRLPGLDALLVVELRTRAGQRVRLQLAIDDPALLAGLPRLEQTGHELAPGQLDDLVALVHTARALGATLARFEAEAASDDASALLPPPERVVLARSAHPTPELLAGLLWLPLLVALPSGWTEWAAIWPGLVATLVVLLARRFAARRVVVRAAGSSFLAWALPLPGWRPLVLARPLEARYVAQHLVWRPVNDKAPRDLQRYTLALEPPRDRKDLARPLQVLERGTEHMQTMPERLAHLTGLVGLPLRERQGGLPGRTSRATGRWALALLGLMLLGGWTSTVPKADGELARLGGWFGGHGDLLTSLTGTFTADYSLLTSPTIVAPVALSPDGRLAATWGDRELLVWDVDSASVVAELELDEFHLTALAFSADGRRLAALGANTVHALWDTSDWDAPPVKLERQVEPAASPPAPGCLGHTVLELEVDARRNEVRIHDAASGQPLVVRLPDLLALADVDGGCGYALLRVVGEGGANVLRLSLEDGSTTRRQVAWPQADPYVEQEAALSSDGRWLAVTGPRRSVHVFSFEDGGAPVEVIEEAFETPRSSVDSGQLAFDPLGRLVTVSNVWGGINKSAVVIQVFDPRDGQPLARYEGGHGDSVHAVAFSADGQRMITGSRDQTAIVWAMP